MCGIAGIWGPQPDQVGLMTAACERMRKRGPDSRGLWQDQTSAITLGHVRLAIVDLTEAGAQPMVSACGRYALVLNGEIYNHLEIRTKLEVAGQAPQWRGHSDTETVLAALAAWGVESTLKAMTGMFALAFWDKADKVLTLCLLYTSPSPRD